MLSTYVYIMNMVTNLELMIVVVKLSIMIFSVILYFFLRPDGCVRAPNLRGSGSGGCSPAAGPEVRGGRGPDRSHQHHDRLPHGVRQDPAAARHAQDKGSSHVLFLLF